MGSLPTRAVLRRGQALPAGLRGSKSLPWEATQEFRDKNLPGSPCLGADVGLKAAGSTPQRPSPPPPPSRRLRRRPCRPPPRSRAASPACQGAETRSGAGQHRVKARAGQQQASPSPAVAHTATGAASRVSGQDSQAPGTRHGISSFPDKLTPTVLLVLGGCKGIRTRGKRGLSPSSKSYLEQKRPTQLRSSV